MKVGLGAADAIRKVHGMNYTVGTSPDVLCKCTGVVATHVNDSLMVEKFGPGLKYLIRYSC